MKKDTLDTKLEEILNWLCGGVDFERGEDVEKAKAQLKSLIKSTLLDALPKEKKMRVVKDNMPKGLDVAMAGALEDFQTIGYNSAIQDIKDSLEGI